jgi:hypothetical protein
MTACSPATFKATLPSIPTLGPPRATPGTPENLAAKDAKMMRAPVASGMESGAWPGLSSLGSGRPGPSVQVSGRHGPSDILGLGEGLGLGLGQGRGTGQATKNVLAGVINVPIRF